MVRLPRPGSKFRTLGVRLVLDRLDERIVPTVNATATINADPLTGGIGQIDDAVRGVNINIGDSRAVLTDPLVLQRAKDAGIRLFRLPGGSSSDFSHFDMQDPDGLSSNDRAKSNWMDLMKFAEAAGGRKIVTLNYGTASPQEAAAWVAYMNGTNAADTTALGYGQYWTIKAGSDVSSRDLADHDFVWKDWRTVGFWVSLRGQSPLATDDGLNFLRVNHPQSFDVEYLEVGNEVYGNWEVNLRSKWADTPNPTAYMPGDYVWFAKTVTSTIRAMQLSVQPKVGIALDAGNGVDTFPGSPLYANWDALALGQCASQNFTPDFVVDHPYAYVPGAEPNKDAYLLKNTSTDATVYANNRNNWVERVKYFRDLAQQKGVPNAAALKVIGTEFANKGNFPLSNQTTNLPNGLWLADTLGQALVAGYAGLNYWSFLATYEVPSNTTTANQYNGYNTDSGWQYEYEYDPALYGWRKGASAFGMIGNGAVEKSNGPQQYGTTTDTTLPGAQSFKPASGRAVPYPVYFAQQLYAQFAHTGDTTLAVTDDNPDLSVYAARQGADGHLRMLVVNKSATNDTYVNFALKNFGLNSPAGVKVWRYGIDRDNAQRDSADGNSYLDQWTQAPDSATVTGADSAMSFWFPQYSMSVIDVGPTTANFLTNPGFEVNLDATKTNQYVAAPTGWTQATGRGYAQSGYGSTPHGGGLYGVHYGDTAYTADTTQTVTSLPTGNYTLSAWVKSSGGQTSANLYVNGYGGAARTAGINTATAGSWSGAWTLVVIPDVAVSNGTAKVGFASNAGAGQWLQFDDVVFARDLTVNPGFESGTAGWDTWTGATGTGAGAFTVPAAGGHASSKYGTHKKTTAYQAETFQVRTAIPNGLYTLTAWVQGSGATANGQTQVMTVKDYGGANLTVAIPATTAWTLVSIPNVRVTNNQAKFGVYSNVTANQWVKFDDVQFFDPPVTADDGRSVRFDLFDRPAGPLTPTADRGAPVATTRGAKPTPDAPTPTFAVPAMAADPRWRHRPATRWTPAVGDWDDESEVRAAVEVG